MDANLTEDLCRWCGAPLKSGAKDCRKCHKKQKPCTSCKGPVGRTTKTAECLKCQQFGIF